MYRFYISEWRVWLNAWIRRGKTFTISILFLYTMWSVGVVLVDVYWNYINVQFWKFAQGCEIQMWQFNFPKSINIAWIKLCMYINLLTFYGFIYLQWNQSVSNFIFQIQSILFIVVDFNRNREVLFISYFLDTNTCICTLQYHKAM